MIDEKSENHFGKRDEDGNRVEQVPVTLKFEPNKPQKELLTQMSRFNIFECHRRAGKSYMACMLLLIMGLACQWKNGRYALISPEAKQGERNVADTLVDIAHEIPGIKYKKSEKKLELPNGCQIFLLGIKNQDALRGGFWDGIVLDEFRDLHDAEYAWNSVIVPSLLKWENKARKGWVLITTTPPQKKHYYTELYNQALDNPEWTVLKYPVSDTGLFSADEIEDMRRMMNPTNFAIEMMCSHSIPAEGAFFTESLMMAEEQGRIDEKYKYDPNLGVYASLDIGIDGTAIWFAQKKDDKYYLIDYYQDLNTDKKISHFINVLRSKPYAYNHIYLPHDTVKQNQLTNKTIFLEFKSIFGGIVKLLKREPVDVGIFRVNNEFHKVSINGVTCKDGLQALREYSPKKDSTKSSFTKKIDHNWASHGADSFRYMIKGLTENSHRVSTNHQWYFKKPESIDYEPF